MNQMINSVEVTILNVQTARTLETFKSLVKTPLLAEIIFNCIDLLSYLF